MEPLGILTKLLPVLAIIGTFFVLLSLMGFYSAIRPSRITSNITPDAFGLTFEDVTITTEDGINLAGWFIPNNHTDKTIILLHGYPADKGNILPSLAFLAQHYNLLLFDFRYLGQSEGAYSTAGAHEVKDLAAAINWLKNRDLNDVGLWGFSLGGAVALTTAGNHPGVKAIISEASYANLNLLAPVLYPLPGLRYPLTALTRLWGKLFLGTDIKDVSPAESARSLRIPILLIHSRNDETIPFEHAQLIQEALRNNPQAQFWFQDNLIHGQLGGEYQQRVTAFFQQNL